MATDKANATSRMDRDGAPVRNGRPAGRAAVICPELRHRASEGAAFPHRESESRLDEAVGLALAIDLVVAHREVVRLARVVPATYLGAGVVERLKEAVEALEIEVVIVDAALSPVQQRNLERGLEAKVIDRTALILDIFAQRARTREGKLQVELAQLTYLMPRLIGQWKHLERLGGGIGTRGPGETQLESDRRVIRARVRQIARDLERVKVHRRVQRPEPAGGAGDPAAGRLHQVVPGEVVEGRRFQGHQARSSVSR